MSRSLRQRIGITTLECPAYLWALWGAGNWVRLHNRLEKLIPAPDGRPGVVCDWRWTSDLRACQLYPFLGRRLLRRAMHDWPLGTNPVRPNHTGSAPEVSFIIGHRGAEKVPHLQAVLQSVLAQAGPAVEVVVVEQAAEPVLTVLPPGVTHVHAPPPEHDTPYNRSAAFNVGARAAQGEILICHDNDLLVPAAYAREACRILRSGGDVAYLGRFLFYLGEEHSRAVLSGREKVDAIPPVRVMQNFQGGTLAIRRDAFVDVGGFDEGFAGWGGEDNEMYDRCAGLRIHRYGYLPFIHLHHPPQPGSLGSRPTQAYLDERLAVPREARIRELSARQFGRPQGIDHQTPDVRSLATRSLA